MFVSPIDRGNYQYMSGLSVVSIRQTIALNHLSGGRLTLVLVCYMSYLSILGSRNISQRFAMLHDACLPPVLTAYIQASTIKEPTEVLLRVSI